MRRRDRRHDNPGRPATVGADARLELRLPAALLAEVTRAADGAGLERSAWCRLALETALTHQR